MTLGNKNSILTNYIVVWWASSGAKAGADEPCEQSSTSATYDRRRELTPHKLSTDFYKHTTTCAINKNLSAFKKYFLFTCTNVLPAYM